MSMFYFTPVTNEMPVFIEEEKKNFFVNGAKELLEEYDYPYSDYGLERIINTWYANKRNIISILSKHPNWDATHMQIIFNSDYYRNWCDTDVREFERWVRINISLPSYIWDEARYILRRIFDEKVNKITKASETLINEEIKDYNNAVKRWNEVVAEEKSWNSQSGKQPQKEILFTVHEGEKVSRIILKLAKFWGLDKIKDIRTLSFSGREKDYGWNYQYAKMCDAINPFKVTKYTIISVNPIDYWTMSFGDSWASCHTIDKENKRRKDSSHNYQGCYSSGTESYMLDEVSIVMYLVDASYEGDLEKADKHKRCMFHFDSEAKAFVQGRVYPDGRDGGEEGIAKQMREVFQKVICECADVPNLWYTKNGTNNNYSRTDSYGTHYRDYLCYNDTSISFYNGNEVRNEDIQIHIGHDPICPNCGCVHERENNILCDDCADVIICAHCGDIISRENAIYDEDTGNYYCNSYCAEYEDCYYCDNVEEWHSEHISWDDYEGGYFYDRYEDHIVARDGSQFRDDYNARAAGYVYTVDEEWIHRNNACYCEECNEWVDCRDWNEEREMCNNCAERIEFVEEYGKQIIKEECTMKMNKKNLTRFITICKMSEKELKAFLHERMKNYFDDKDIINGDGFLYCKGNYPVLLTAHMDTVHKELVKDVEMTVGMDKGGEEYHVISSPQGIGGDDRCGVYMILSILKKTNKNSLPSILFCEQEEKGGVGSEKFCKTKYINDLKEMKFLIELDRANRNDIVFYDDANYEFHDFVEDQTNFFENFGSFSDISVLSPACGVSSVNISCGYYKAHTTQEYVIWEDMMEAIEATELLIKGAETCKQFKYKEYNYSKYTKINNVNNYNYYDYNYYENYYNNYNTKVGLYIEFVFDGKTENIYIEGKTEAECWKDFFMEHSEICFNDVLDFYCD